jgi:methionine sulfoxide reductase catalytic subunit
MLIKKAADVASSEITPKRAYLSRRMFVAGAAAAGASLLAGRKLLEMVSPAQVVEAGAKLNTVKGPFGTDEKLTPYKDVTTYNNFYEFSTDKDGPSQLAKNFRTRPWQVKVEGLVQKPRTFDIDDILKLAPLEDRIYRHRCVEGWSMVIPWVGYPLSKLLQQVQPLGKAKYVEFTTLLDPQQMPGERTRILDWPYVEGLRLDEAMHPLAILCVGLYGEALPNQDGAPVRIVVPWKYGFKSAKSIVKIRLVEQQPINTWNRAAPEEYGFYSNVNPDVDHPRWSQKTERRIDGSGFFASIKKIPTRMFNGYGDQVAQLYSGMDLRKNF